MRAFIGPALLLGLGLPPAASAAPSVPEHSHGFVDDGLDMLKHAGWTFVHQFTSRNSLYLATAMVGSSVLLNEDELEHVQAVKDAGVLGETTVGTLDVAGAVLNFGVVPIATYVLGRIIHDEKLIHFSVELASMTLVLGIETSVLSNIPVHDRPNVEFGLRDPSTREFSDGIRGASAWPSGHQVALNSLAWKGWEYYGWQVGLPATVASAVMSYSRIEQGEHYVNDIVAAYLLTGIVGLASTTARTDDTRAVLDAHQGLELSLGAGPGRGLSLVGRF